MKLPSEKLIASARAFVKAGEGKDQAEWSHERIERYEAARAIVGLADENVRLTRGARRKGLTLNRALNRAGTGLAVIVFTSGLPFFVLFFGTIYAFRLGAEFYGTILPRHWRSL